ncbi:nicotinamide-nucleotide amidohydrolase family protein [Rhodopirellula sp. JC740]|uniref:Nicotinamide-nucleotide amidohydrolase family protein n=1 Tax=Rhodopirellula halodulae TaxID=2894198 RepID=A0ABS8NFS3_9BACT|nr:nicotinamide-nucleotide amidohydrolase family protein [Rhodopirellula sp. JC740]MCC9642393.1 nicotinamide-nucleotide amidohydrolase family protein [Rhodopirellula sp. JC740]
MTSSNLESSVVDDPREVATALVALLKRTQNRLILAESCTCGAAAAAIGSIPGASQVFCGSAVTYRETTKQAWLGITAADLKQHTAESQAITNAMATSVLERTPDATIAAAITGHLGPDAPPEVDGIVFVAVQQRGKSVRSSRHQLSVRSRQARQLEATTQLLRAIQSSLVDGEI